MKRKINLPPSSDILATVSMTLIKSFSLSLNSRSTSSRPRATICLKSNKQSIKLVDCLPIPTSAECTQRNKQRWQSCQVHYTHVLGNDRRAWSRQSWAGRAWRQELNTFAWGLQSSIKMFAEAQCSNFKKHILRAFTVYYPVSTTSKSHIKCT